MKRGKFILSLSLLFSLVVCNYSFAQTEWDDLYVPIKESKPRPAGNKRITLSTGNNTAVQQSQQTSAQSQSAVDYNTEYGRRLRGLDSPSESEQNQGYYGSNAGYSDGMTYAQTGNSTTISYDPRDYNVTVSGNDVYIEPKYMNSTYGVWTAPVTLNTWGYTPYPRSYWWNMDMAPYFAFSIGWGNGYYDPWWGGYYDPWWGSPYNYYRPYYHDHYHHNYYRPSHHHNYNNVGGGHRPNGGHKPGWGGGHRDIVNSSSPYVSPSQRGGGGNYNSGSGSGVRGGSSSGNNGGAVYRPNRSESGTRGSGNYNASSSSSSSSSSSRGSSSYNRGSSSSDNNKKSTSSSSSSSSNRGSSSSYNRGSSSSSSSRGSSSSYSPSRSSSGSSSSSSRGGGGSSSSSSDRGSRGGR